MPEKPPSKSEILSHIASSADLSRKQVAAVFEALHGLIKKHVSKKGAGLFVIPGLLKINVIHKPATPERQGINPFTKQPTVFKAKPARRVVKIRALKALKDFVK
ncbi:MAG TPA: HU family DNA-binding protein [Phycisphaerae bacterium]|nr:HU family DNA-binding protein [Phycisphaerae bacterium]